MDKVGGTLEGPSDGGGGLEGARLDGRGESTGGAPGRGGSSMGLVQVSDSRLVGRLGNAARVLGSLVRVERSWRISAAGISGKSVKLMDPVGSAARSTSACRPTMLPSLCFSR